MLEGHRAGVSLGSTISCGDVAIMPPVARIPHTGCAHVVSGAIMATCLTTGDVNLGHLGKVVSAGLLHSKVTIFPFLINK